MSHFRLKILFTLTFSLLLFSCVAKDKNTYITGNLLKVETQLILHNHSFELHNTVHPTSSKTIHFYITPCLDLPSLMVTNLTGHGLKYDISKSTSSYFVTVYSQGDSTIHIDYTVGLSKLPHSISHHVDKNQCFLLCETNLYPRNSDSSIPNNHILYTLTIKDTSPTYESYYPNNTSTSIIPPSIILGNFNRVDCNSTPTYIPKDIAYDKERLHYIVSQYKQSYAYYNHLFGASSQQANPPIFFLKRRGGYAVPYGIIVDQKFLTHPFTFDQTHVAHIVSHETAHLWWGITSAAPSFYMNETLADFSSNLYLDSHKIMDTKHIYSYNNLCVLNANLAPRDLASVALNDKQYKAYAYQKGPILLHELALKLGTDSLLSCMRNYYNASKHHYQKSSIKDLDTFLPADIQKEFQTDTNGTLTNWPDYYIQEVSHDQVIFGAHAVQFSEIVPVDITLADNTMVKDTLHFDSTTTEVTKHYAQEIKKVVLDGDFATNQSYLLNDLWVKNKSSIIYNKWEYAYGKEYQVFFDTLLTYLFTPENPSIKDIVAKKDIPFLAKAKHSLEQVHITGSIVFIQEKKHSFKIMVCFPHKTAFSNGYISGYYYKENGQITLQSIVRFAI